MAQISIQNLTFTYPDAVRPALSGVSLDVPQGSFVLLFGKTGCGKTSLLRHLKTALAPHGNRTGVVYFDGVPIDDVPPREQAAGIGYVMQDPDAQIVTDRVWHELAFGLENIGLAQDEMRLRVAEIASYFGIQEWLDRSTAELSGGQKQLLALASVLALRPSVLVLDEPTSQLDPISAADFLSTVRKVNEEFGTTVIISEHRLEELYPHASWVVAMDEGCICAQGEPRNVATELLESAHDLAFALPVAARVVWQVNASCPDAANLPLSTSEGRAWLRARVGEQRTAEVSDIENESHQDAPAAVEAKDVWFRYGRDLPDVFKGASFTIPQGVTFAFVGGNGVGKSTMLRLACGSAKPYLGSVSLLGKKLSAWPQDTLYSEAVALLPQDPTSLFAQKTVRAELEEMVPPGMPSNQAASALDVAARLCDVDTLGAMHPLDLSGGQAQRLALAKILVRKPRVLLLDEPTKGIDAVYKHDLAALFAQLKAEGHTIVIASHDIEFCARYADAVALLFDGQVATCGSPRDVFTAASYYTTAANRIARGVLAKAVVEEDLVSACQS